MDKNLEIIRRQYKTISHICFQLAHSLSDLENEFRIMNARDKETLDSTKEVLKTIQNDFYAAAELLYELIKDEEYIREEII